ncbi:MAG: hypothetical protein ACSLFH_15085 [Desulfuromonadales bacterium]
MFKKELIIGVLATFFLMGLLGTAFAGEGDYTSAVGTDQFSFDVQSMNHEAAINHDYNQKQLAAVGTEAGYWKIDFAAPESNAAIAAKDYNYNQQHLALVATEGGDWKFNNSAPEAKGNAAQATDAKKNGALCSDC